jgi:DNA-binding NtrC family response regulator
MSLDPGLIIIIDDEPDMLWALENVLLKHGHVVHKADSASEAISVMKERKFDVALLDAKLPDMEGLELAVMIKETNPDISIIMISGYYYRDDDHMKKAMASGLISNFVAKPFDHNQLLDLVESARSISQE